MNWTGGARFRNFRETTDKQKQKEYFSNKRSNGKKQASFPSRTSELLQEDSEPPFSLDLIHLDLAGTSRATNDRRNDNTGSLEGDYGNVPSVRHVNLDTPHRKNTTLPRTVYLRSSPELSPSRLCISSDRQDTPAHIGTPLHSHPEYVQSNQRRASHPFGSALWKSADTAAASPSIAARKRQQPVELETRQHATQPMLKKPYITTPSVLTTNAKRLKESHSPGEVSPCATAAKQKAVQPVQNYLFERMLCPSHLAEHQEKPWDAETVSVPEVAHDGAASFLPAVPDLMHGVSPPGNRNSMWHSFIQGLPRQSSLPPQMKMSTAARGGSEHEEETSRAADTRYTVTAVRREERDAGNLASDTDMRQPAVLSCARQTRNAQEALDEVLMACSGEQNSMPPETLESDSPFSCDSEMISSQDSRVSSDVSDTGELVSSKLQPQADDTNRMEMKEAGERDHPEYRQQVSHSPTMPECNSPQSTSSYRSDDLMTMKRNSSPEEGEELEYTSGSTATRYSTETVAPEDRATGSSSVHICQDLPIITITSPLHNHAANQKSSSAETESGSSSHFDAFSEEASRIDSRLCSEKTCSIEPSSQEVEPYDGNPSQLSSQLSAPAASDGPAHEPGEVLHPVLEASRGRTDRSTGGSDSPCTAGGSQPTPTSLPLESPLIDLNVPTKPESTSGESPAVVHTPVEEADSEDSNAARGDWSTSAEVPSKLTVSSPTTYAPPTLDNSLPRASHPLTESASWEQPNTPIEIEKTIEVPSVTCKVSTEQPCACCQNMTKLLVQLQRSLGRREQLIRDLMQKRSLPRNGQESPV